MHRRCLSLLFTWSRRSIYMVRALRCFDWISGLTVEGGKTNKWRGNCAEVAFHQQRKRVCWRLSDRLFQDVSGLFRFHQISLLDSYHEALKPLTSLDQHRHSRLQWGASAWKRGEFILHLAGCPLVEAPCRETFDEIAKWVEDTFEDGSHWKVVTPGETPQGGSDDDDDDDDGNSGWHG